MLENYWYLFMSTGCVGYFCGPKELSRELYSCQKVTMSFREIDHPLARHYLTQLRDEGTSHPDFRRACDALSRLLVLEATYCLTEEPVSIKTPLEHFDGQRIAESPVIVPILRAGLGMLQAFVDLLPEIAVGYFGMERDEQTAEAHTYYSKLPPLEGRRAFVIDPMLATGGSAEHVVKEVYAAKPSDVTMVCIVAAPEGVQRLEKAFPGLEIIAGSLDRQLNDKAYILPGLGDFGDRLYGT